MLTLFHLMISHNSHRLSHSFFIHFTFFSSDWISINDPIFKFTDSLVCLLHSAAAAFYWIFLFHSLYSSAPQFLFDFYFMVSISLLNFLCMVYLISFCAFWWLVELLQNNLNSLSSKLEISISLWVVTRKLFYSFAGIMFP